MLYGGSGADLFKLSGERVKSMIRDFQLGLDRTGLDRLSQSPRLTSDSISIGQSGSNALISAIDNNQILAELENVQASSLDRS